MEGLTPIAGEKVEGLTPIRHAIRNFDPDPELRPRRRKKEGLTPIPGDDPDPWEKVEGLTPIREESKRGFDGVQFLHKPRRVVVIAVFHFVE